MTPTVWLPFPHFTHPALCAETDPDRWFPEKGNTTRDVKAVCGKCEARDECLAWALAKPERYGVWGGKSEQQRERIRAQMRLKKGVMTAPRRRPIPPRPMTVRECADAMGVSKMTVFRLIHSGTLPAFRVRQQFRVPVNEFERFMRAAAVVPDWAME